MRRRLVLSTLLLVLAALLAFAVPLAASVRNVLEARALDGLQSGVEQLQLVFDVSARTCGELQLFVAQTEPSATRLTLIRTDGRVLATTADAGRAVVGGEVRDAAQGRVGRRVGDGQVAVAVPLTTQVCGAPTVLHAAQPDDALRRGTRSAWVAIGGVATGVAALAAGSAWLLGRRLARPFEALTDSARRLGDGDFSARAPRSGLPEADAIAAALDGTAERLGRAVERSASFTADASHQLRTPLTALRLQLEALETAGADPAAIDAALAEADRLEATIDDLVALTRVDAPEVEVDLGELLGSRLPGWRSLAAEQGRTVDLEVVPTPRLRVRTAAIVQAVQVLVDNALEHGEGAVTVRIAPARPDQADGAVRVCVRDHGPGPHGDDGARVGGDARAGDRPPAGGRGLPLARALVAAEGGRLTLADAGPGTLACLVLPGRRGDVS